MNISKKISVIILYFLIVHVYSFVHFHAHEHENQIELHISVHPPDLPIHEHHHEDHHCHSQHAGETDVISDWNVIPQKNITKVKSYDFFITLNTNLKKRPAVTQYNYYDSPLKFPQDDVVKTLPQRAPPKVS